MELRYGQESWPLPLAADRIRQVIRPQLPLASGSAEHIIATALHGVEGELSRFTPGQRVVIVVSDITRASCSHLVLPPLVERLYSRGIGRQDLEIVIALGIHRRQSEQEHRQLLGPLFGEVRVVDHDCDDTGKLVYLGTTSNGIPVEINRSVAEADQVILTGTIGYHYFAGFGGGRKSILPGVASRKSCMASHYAVLNPTEGSGKNPHATTGVLDGNPVHGAMMEACAMVEPAFILNTVLAPDKSLLAAFSGHWRHAHLEGCRYYGEAFSCPVDSTADLVVVSCGGFPKDINLIQAHKSMEYASRALRDGGVMILLAQCRDGYGHPTFFSWFRHRDLTSFEEQLRRQYEINGQTAYSVLQKAQRFRIILVSELPPEEVRSMSMTPAADLAEALSRAEDLLPTDYTAYVIPEGGAVLPVVGP
ncbi:MAG TPA: nickel-dependent lactate racemase [Geobacterales bacterium]|nr:nickel-dependent lactate racemase [Geobacterales bacterium]